LIGIRQTLRASLEIGQESLPCTDKKGPLVGSGLVFVHRFGLVEHLGHQVVGPKVFSQHFIIIMNNPTMIKKTSLRLLPFKTMARLSGFRVFSTEKKDED
jgi:hypothetical protein